MLSIHLELHEDLRDDQDLRILGEIIGRHDAGRAMPSLPGSWGGAASASVRRVLQQAIAFRVD